MPGGDKLYAITYGAGSTNVINSINDRRAMVIYTGHGSQTGWAGPNLSQAQVRNLTGVAVPYVASHACMTGDFTVNESFADTWVIEPEYGALTIASASNYSYWYEDDTLERAVFNTLYADPTGALVPSVREMLHAGLAAVDASGTNLDRYYWEEYHLFGDPSLEIILGPKLPDFTLSLQPPVLNTCSTDSQEAAVNVGSLNQYHEPVALTASPLAGFSLNIFSLGGLVVAIGVLFVDVMSLRAVGEGHISSVTFREGIAEPDGDFTLWPQSAFATSVELDDESMTDADSAVTVRRHPESSLSNTVIFPITEQQRGGLEDLRMVRFRHDFTCHSSRMEYALSSASFQRPSSKRLATRHSGLGPNTLSGPSRAPTSGCA